MMHPCFSLYIMKQSLRPKDIIIGLFIILAGMIGVRILRHCLHGASHDDLSMTAEETAVFRQLRQEALADSARRAARRQEWAEERQRRAARKQAYQDSQAVWKARRHQWAEEKAARMEERAARQACYDSIMAGRPEKLKAGTVVEANTADTLLLQRVPGIGPVLARSIVAYRKALGGFVSAAQVEEVGGVPAGIARWFVVEGQGGAVQVHRLDLNRDDFRMLVRHPYLSYEQVREIVQFRRHHPILSLRTLQGLNSFSEADVQRLEPYVSF